MLPNGTRIACSDARDAKDNYIWRENGVEAGQCCGIDFKQAKQKRDARQCKGNDFVCEATELSGYVPYAYDAAIALAYGLDKLVTEGVHATKMTAKRLFKAVQESSFAGVTGHVSFKENGDRHTADMDYIVYNYQSKGDIHRFEDVGHMTNRKFVRCEGYKCPPLVFHDGTESVPNVKRTVRETHRHALICVLVCRLSEHLHCAPTISPTTDIVYWYELSATCIWIYDDLCRCSTWAAYSDNMTKRTTSAQLE